MVKNKSEALLDLLLGVVFIAAGGLFIAMRSEMLIVKIVLIADIAIGALLLLCGISGLLKREDAVQDFEDDAWNAEPEQEPVREAVPAAEPEYTEPAAEEPVQAETQPVEYQPSVEELTAYEADLRKLVKQRRAEARQAAEAAEQSAAAAAEAEQALIEAENAMKYVSDAEKSSYLAKIDRIADDAMEKSQQAAYATRRAKAAEKAYRQAVEAHRDAMDAAAEAMMAAEEAEWNGQ